MSLLAAPREILRINPGALFVVWVAASPEPEALAFPGTAIIESPSSRWAGGIRGNEGIRPRSASVADCRGVPEGLEAFEKVCEGRNELGVYEYMEAQGGAEEGLGAGGTDVLTLCSFGGFGSEPVTFKLAWVSPFMVEGDEAAA